MIFITELSQLHERRLVAAGGIVSEVREHGGKFVGVGRFFWKIKPRKYINDLLISLITFHLATLF